MVKPSNDYNPDSYGSGIRLMAEGTHVFVIEDIEETDGKFGLQWLVEAHPVVAEHKSRYPKLVWLSADGVINALYNAMGIDPAKVEQNRDYQPHEFIGKQIYGVIVHKEIKDKMRDNLQRLCPAFTKGLDKLVQQQGQTPPPRQEPQQNNDFGGDDFGDSQVPF